MTTEQVDARARLYLYTSAHCTPEDDHEDLEEALKAYVKEEEDQIAQDLRLGLASFERAKPRDQLDAFLVATLPEDMEAILTDGWYEARIMGLAPPLVAEQMYYQEQTQIVMAAQLAEITGGMPPAPREPQPTDFWVLILLTRAAVFKRLQADFRKLLREEARKA